MHSQTATYNSKKYKKLDVHQTYDAPWKFQRAIDIENQTENNISPQYNTG